LLIGDHLREAVMGWGCWIMTGYELGRSRLGRLAVMAAVLTLAGAAQAAQSGPKPEYPTRKARDRGLRRPSPRRQAGRRTGRGRGRPTGREARKKSIEIGSQPARDVGAIQAGNPADPEKALGDPYSLKGLKTCAQLSTEVRKPQRGAGRRLRHRQRGPKENRAGKLAEAGGKTIINSIIPFRSLVREVTGAAPADRHMNAVVDAGLARRGFLRGVHYKQKCRTTF
jgi:hypothetical protein